MDGSSRVAGALALIVAGLVTAGCKADPYCGGPKEVVDSVGTVFAWDLETCAAGWAEDTPDPLGPCAAEDRSVISTWNRFYEVALACGSGWTDIEIRPLACETDDDCPWFDVESRGGLWEYECRAGLCQNADTEAYPEDFVPHPFASTLCNAPLPRGEPYLGPDFCPGQDFSSEEPCPLPLPAECMQPF